MESNIKQQNTIVYAGRIRAKKTLLSSSSGGAFTALSDYFLENNEAVVASVYNYNTHAEEFHLILNKAERDQAKGSIYVQSDPGEIFKTAEKWLMDNPLKSLLFVGMGCQSEGFRKFAEIKGFRERVCIVDIICHGTPSPKLWKDYIRFVEKRHNGKVAYVTFKDKRNGWRNPTALVSVNNKEIKIREYVKIFYNQCALRPSCYSCPFATIERKTDITIGDFWHIEETMPDFYDSDGTSVFLIHTGCGNELFKEIKDNLIYKLSDKEQCLQDNLNKPTSVSDYRDIFWQDYRKYGIEFVVKKYGSISIIARIKSKIANYCKSKMKK